MTQFKFFTLVEFLVVISILFLLASLTQPTLKKAFDTARTTNCQYKLKQFGLSSNLYGGDHEDFLAISSFNNATTWYRLLTPYLLGREWSLVDMPNKSPGSFFTCPENPEGTFWGQGPSWSTTQSHHSDGEFGLIPMKSYVFLQPQSKAYLFGSNHHNTRYLQFHAQSRLVFRHMNNEMNNILFMDGHTNGYGSPPIPFVRDDPLAKKWLLPDTDIVDGL